MAGREPASGREANHDHARFLARLDACVWTRRQSIQMEAHCPHYLRIICAAHITDYNILYLFKGLFNGHLRACLGGTWAGLASSSIRRRHPDKLSCEETGRNHSPARGRDYRLGRG
jgi:hypothetical protein